MSQLPSLLRISLSKVSLLALFSGLLVKGLCPSWFLGLIVSITTFQLTGIVLLRMLRPHASLDLSPTLMARATWLLSAVWIAILLWSSLLVGSDSHFYLKNFAYVGLGTLHLVSFVQISQRWSALVIPASAFLRPRA